MTGNLKWHSCSSNDFPPKRNKVSKACEACRGKKMRCDGMQPCHRCKTNNTECNYDNKSAKPRSNIKKEKQVKPEHRPPINGRKWIFGNDVYETLKTHQSPKTRRYGSLPLLCDFFNTSTQPQSIWQEFISMFQHCCTFQPSQNSNDYFMRDIPEGDQSQLAKSAIQLFSNHNILYNQFIDIPQILSILDTISIFSHMQSSRQHQKNGSDSLHYILTVVYGIFALVFQSAYQAFPLLGENIQRELYVYSYQFYNEARKRFLETCFPSTPQSCPKREYGSLLLQASVLLAHFQCIAIGKDQAWMTIRIGLDVAQRKGCLLWSPDDDTLQERERCITLMKTIDAWHVWLAFSLQRPYFAEWEIPSSSGKQTWALHVTDAHTLFLKSVLKKKSTDSTNTKMIK
ncbi:hypothetical protein K501DRAFT_276705, partial [Backusella circina FSU 941]